MPAIHLLNKPPKAGVPQPTLLDSGEWESGYWAISENRSTLLLEHPIHLHRKKSEPAFLSGVVTAWRRVPYRNPKTHKVSFRTVFTFVAQPEGTVTSPDGWSWAGIKYVH